MAVTWKLSGGSVASPTPVGELGVSGLVLTRRNFARDELTFQVGGDAGAALFAYGDTVTLTRDDGGAVVWFVGRRVKTPKRIDGRGEGTAYTIAGPWWYFENLVYQQIWPLDPAANSHLTSPATYRRAIVVAGLASSSGLRQNTKQFVEDVLGYLIAANSPAAPVVQYSAGALPTGFEVPFTRLDSPTCAEAIHHIARWMPDAACRFRYHTTPPTFEMKRRSAATVVSIAASDCGQINLDPRDELVLANLVIQFVTQNGSGTIVLNEDKSPPTATGKEWGSAVFALDNNYKPLPSGLAAAYRAGLSTLHYSGNIVVSERECSGVALPGDVVNLTGGLTEWATMNAHVTQTSEDIDRGTTTLTVGPENSIRMDDLVEILKIARNQADQFGGSTEILKTGSTASKNQTLTATLNPAAAVPTGTEIATAIATAYSGKPAPRGGDTVDILIDNTPYYMAAVSSVDPAIATPGAYVVGVTAGGVTRYARIFIIGAARTITQPMTVAVKVPTDTEVRTALVAAFTATARPFHGDAVMLTVGGVPKFRYTVDFKVTAANGIRVVAFTMSGRTWYAVAQQLGIY